MRRSSALIVLGCLFALAAAGCGGTPAPAVPKSINGFGWGWTVWKDDGTGNLRAADAGRGDYLLPGTVDSLQALADTGAQWISLSFQAHMKSLKTTEILYAESDGRMVADAELERAIGLARENKLRILLKPAIAILDGSWRARINFEGKDLDEARARWDEWWANYEKYILHYAALAAKTGCEAFCVGSEMNSTEVYSRKWRAIVGKIRGAFPGLLTYSVNHDHMESIDWWDALDFIGVSAYYSLARSETIDDLKRSWQPGKAALQALSQKTKKPVLFIEIGIRSARGLAVTPWDYLSTERPYDAEEQARYYEAAFQTFWNEEWFLGFLWWDWPVTLYPVEHGKKDTGFSVYGKPAEGIVSHWFSKPR